MDLRAAVDDGGQRGARPSNGPGKAGHHPDIGMAPEIGCVGRLVILGQLVRVRVEWKAYGTKGSGCEPDIDEDGQTAEYTPAPPLADAPRFPMP